MNQNVDAFFKAASGGASYRQMGADSGISYSTIRRQLSGEGELTAQVVVALARTYGQNVLDALAIAGFITRDEAGTPHVVDALRRASDLELAHEIMRRAADGTASKDLTEPLPEVPSLADRRKNVSGTVQAIPNNVEAEWADRVAAYDDTKEPIDHDS